MADNDARTATLAALLTWHRDIGAGDAIGETPRRRWIGWGAAMRRRLATPSSWPVPPLRRPPLR
jgi:hypothetical protein